MPKLFLALAMVAIVSMSVNASTIGPALRSVENAKSAIKKEQVSRAIVELRTALANLQEHQRRILHAYFPDEFLDFRVIERIVSDSSAIQGELNSVLFSLHYENDDNQSIDINVVFADPSILEFVDIVKNKKYQKTFSQLSVVKVKEQYNALEKSSEDGLYTERNIILSTEAAVNIIATGYDSPSVMTKFCDRVQFDQLANFLLP